MSKSRAILYIIASVVCIILPIVFNLYHIWDINQPKTGAVGDGKTNYPNLPQLLPSIFSLIIGIGNLPVAILRYKQSKDKTK
ncbi:hypothetical protein [Paenibacillus glycanilyticus]|uniref:Uncharacterized protein n=1 Tax=Paenibacillus glycanilyticus TaxID=126569 RepID=A0ABQ6GJ50_9BACL|nr:hypothetical protein [Paenibacillus glycanilyticus]GLX69662.1 hypothetical protein MU1_40070 [Paenibacillus glycanilyticus]